MLQKRCAEKAPPRRTAVSRKSSVRFSNVWGTSNVGKAHTRRVVWFARPTPAARTPPARPAPLARLPLASGPFAVFSL